MNNNNKITADLKRLNGVISGNLSKVDLSLTVTPQLANKTSRYGMSCLCHMIREMGSCSLNEVVKKHKKSLL